MRVDSSRWVEVTPSEFPHEREGLSLLRELLPDRSPFRAWTNFEFRDRDGKWHEVDALVLGERRLHVVELKHYRGTLTGNAYRWQRGGRSEDSPLLLARRKAQRLKSVIVEALSELGHGDRSLVPFVQHSVFLHAADFRCALPPGDGTDLFGRDDRERSSGLPGLASRLLEGRLPGERPGLIDADDLLASLFERIGFALRREREVGSWRLTGEPSAEGDGWQDWPAEHRVARDRRARIRFFVSKPGASQVERAGVRSLAEREFALTSRLRHDGVLHPDDIVDDELGVGLVYPDDPALRRLDLWLADHGGQLSLRERVAMVRQLAEALAYAHRHHVVHRGLAPSAVLAGVRDGVAELLLGDWQVAGADAAADTRQPSGTATRLFALLEGRDAAVDPSMLAYGAPEGRWSADADRVRLDVFGLGALTYFLVAGVPPATSAVDLRERLAKDGGLDLVADVPEAPGGLRALVLHATRPTVSARLADVSEFLLRLDVVDRELAGAAELVTDPLDATPGMLLGGRFELVRRLGSGSTAVGLLVADRAAEGTHRVLKVALDDAAAGRLRGEAEVLASLGPLAHPRLVRLAEPEPLRLGDRIALLLESAGESTLADELRGRPRLSLDLLERYGGDLLDAVVALDRAKIDHRDIKPANLGVRTQRGDRSAGDRAKHLVLFDFSLSRAGAAEVSAGTPPYLDPFLGRATRSTWDSAAERYAAAVTLFEMATGTLPRYGDGASDPAAITDEATVEPGLFDSSIAAALTVFFRRALRRDAGERFDTAAQMLAAWRAVFGDRATTVADDADVIAAAATATTPLPTSGLSARALSALEPLHLNTVGELAAVDQVRLSRLRGAAEVTRREIRIRVKQWRTAGLATATAAAASGEDGGADPRAATSILTTAARTEKRQWQTRRLLGLDGPLDPFSPGGELVDGLAVGGQPQVSQALRSLQDAYATSNDACALLDAVLARAVTGLAELGGVATVDEVAEALAAGAVDADGVPAARVTAGLLRLSLDRADLIEREGGTASPLWRRRRRGRRPLLATSPALLDAADALGTAAEALVTEAAAADERLVPVGRAAPRLRERWPADAGPVDDLRLVRLAAKLSARAGATRRGELHDREMGLADALALAVGAVAAGESMTAAELAQRVRARFPDLPPLPTGARLQQLIGEAELPLAWDGSQFVTPGRGPETTFASRVSSVGVTPVQRGLPAEAGGPLAESGRERSFLALAVTARLLDDAARKLVAEHAATRVDVTAVLLAALREQAAAKGVPWDAVRAADAAAAGTRPAQGLAALVTAALPAVEQAITAALAVVPQGGHPVLLTEAAPLARYGHLQLITRLADLTFRRSQAVWLLLPYSEAGAALDGVPLRLGHAGQYLRLEDDWLRGPTQAGVPA